MHRGWLVLAVAALFSLSTGWQPRVAHAVDEPDMSEARALFLAGRVAFDEGRFETAIKYFEASYEQSQRPALLYNIAQCFDRLRRDAPALAAFERYLALAPDADNRALVEVRVQALRAALAAQATEAPASVTEPPTPMAPAGPTRADTPAPSSASAPHWSLAPALTLGAGALVALTGGVLMLVGQGQGTDVEHAKLGSRYETLRADMRAAERQWLAGEVLLGAGAAAASAGLIWLLLKRPREHAATRVALSPTALSVAGVF
jgi:tetratricopeptide (TPR) repeat protein